MEDLEYAGFWIRVGASLIDTILLMTLIVPLMSLVYGDDFWTGQAVFFGFWDLILNYLLPAVAVILFWNYRSATPGKMALSLKIVDANTGESVPTGRLIGRYLGYYVSIIPFCLGLIWVGIDKRKQGWHDKLAGTVVVRDKRKEPVRFNA